MAVEPEVRIAGGRARIVQRRKVLLDVPIEKFAGAIARAVDRTSGGGPLPRGVRYLLERGDATAVAVEIEPHARSIPWVADDSTVPYGPEARYSKYFLAFPYVVLLLVFQRGALTSLHQLFYRTRPLDAEDDALLLPNLLNVARGYGQQCWVCLQNLPPAPRGRSWAKTVDAIVDHVFTAAFNRSSEEHEGNSYWGSMRDLDPRLSSVEAWQAASRENPFFPLEVAWRPAGAQLVQELRSMLDAVVDRRPLASASDLAGLMTQASRIRRRP